MSGDLALLLAIVLVGAAVLVAHLAILLRALRSSLPGKWKLLALIPVVTPVASWRGGARVGPILWGVLLVAYVVLRIVGAE